MEDAIEDLKGQAAKILLDNDGYMIAAHKFEPSEIADIIKSRINEHENIIAEYERVLQQLNEATE